MHRIRILTRLAIFYKRPSQFKRIRSFCFHIPSTSFSSEAASKYEKKSPIEHVLLRPDTYIGGVGMREIETVWMKNEGEFKREITSREVTYPPGLLKIFDEILVNAADNKSRDPKMNRLEVWLDRETPRISVWNNGIGLPVEIHPSENIYVPSLVFGNLFTSSNYNDSEVKTVGGRNGYGAKLCNIFSKEFIVETVDSNTKRRFKQVEFVPDLERFHINEMSDDIVQMIEKRVFEVAATLPNNVDVFFNGQKCDVDGFEDYVKMFNASDPSSFLFLHPTSRWHVGVAKRVFHMEENQINFPKVVSFVNNINTEKGGTHVDYVMDKLVNILKPMVDSKLKDTGRSVKPAFIKNHLSVFINCLIENPSFESQTKETVTTKPKHFGSIFDCDSVVREYYAEWAGISGKSDKCTLILTEGDSAKALALAGLEVLGREKYGVFPLKGKLINVSNLDEIRASKNEEISNLVRILGLNFNDPSPSHQSIRYGRLLILSDQDEDGSHIKGLVINFIHKFWPTLIHSGDFIQSFRTPLLKAKKGDEIKSFFSMNEYKKWAESSEGKWKIKYYKGLGTSTSNEAREYFSNLDHHIVNFKYTGTTDDESIRMVFDRERSDERKIWIRKFEENVAEDPEIDAKNEISYEEFVDGQLMEFGMIDLKRSIPSLVDGLKPSQRKVLWTLLNMDESIEMKVSQLAGAVAHRQSYHHGEESLLRTIIRMGQSFCGSSNLPLLQPIGQFGTRHEGGNDAASARYIFTSLAPTTRLLFPRSDDDLLIKNVEEGMIVEPKWLCPIIPLILVNGTEGIGTGWSTKIANRNPIDTIGLIRKRIDSEDINEDISPFYQDYNGKIEVVNSTKFTSSGKIKIIRPERINASSFSIDITELPIGIWTSKYKEKLSKIMENLPVTEFSEKHSEKRVHFHLSVDRKKASRFLQKSNSDLLNYFKLRTSITENRVLFNENCQLKEYGTVSEIVSEFFNIRRNLYERRLEIQREECVSKLKYVDNQIKFIDLVTNGTIELRSMGREQLEEKLEHLEFETDPLVSKSKMKTSKKSRDYNYLLEMPLSRLTSDEMNRLNEKREKRKKDLETAESADWQSTWHNELDKLAAGIKKN
uniref:DNA topoisomerase 2 n=1 Tax=Caenorhabditis tropicalis TaxID=1561998 RepID=A0A1I7TBE0_9PELO